MSLGDLGKKAQELADKAGEALKGSGDQVGDLLKSEQAEQISDAVLGGAADLANKLTGGKHADKIEEVRQNLDGQIGNE